MRMPRRMMAAAPMETRTSCWVMSDKLLVRRDAGSVARVSARAPLDRESGRKDPVSGRGAVAGEQRVSGVDDVGVARQVVVDDQGALAASQRVVAVAADRDDEDGTAFL